MKKRDEEIASNVSGISGALAELFLKDTLIKGKPVEIPSLGIKIDPENQGGNDADIQTRAVRPR